MSSVAVGALGVLVLPLLLAAFFLPPPPAVELVVTSDTGMDDSESDPASDRRAATAVARFCLVGRRGADDAFFLSWSWRLFLAAGAASAAAAESASAPLASRPRLLLLPEPAAATTAAASAAASVRDTASPSTLVPMLLAPAVPRDVPRGSEVDAAPAPAVLAAWREMDERAVARLNAAGTRVAYAPQHEVSAAYRGLSNDGIHFGEKGLGFSFPVVTDVLTQLWLHRILRPDEAPLGIC